MEHEIDFFQTGTCFQRDVQDPKRAAIYHRTREECLPIWEVIRQDSDDGRVGQ